MTAKSKQKRVLCIFKKREPLNDFIQILMLNGYFVYDYPEELEALAHIYNEPPDIILLSADTKGWKKFLLTMKNDPVYGHLPLILILPDEFKAHLNSLTPLPFDDWIYSHQKPDEFLLRVRMREIHGNRYLDANPLTRLPGNISIRTMIQNRIDMHTDFALGYLDIDNFKAFNDSYGFARGDDMIRMTARILTNVVGLAFAHQGFVGHVGGDDFLFIVRSDFIKDCCKQIIQNFTIVSTTLANDADRIRGFIETEDRQGKLRKFPLPTISIAAIDSKITKLFHAGEAAAIAGEIKKEVKKLSGSNYMINRRTKK